MADIYLHICLSVNKVCELIIRIKYIKRTEMFVYSFLNAHKLVVLHWLL